MKTGANDINKLISWLKNKDISSPVHLLAPNGKYTQAIGRKLRPIEKEFLDSFLDNGFEFEFIDKLILCCYNYRHEKINIMKK